MSEILAGWSGRAAQLYQGKTGRKRRIMLGLLSVLALLIIVVSFGLGQYAVSPLNVIRILGTRLIEWTAGLFGRDLVLSRSWEAAAETVVINIRLPRIILGVLVGAGLSVAGSTFQAIFRNPMVSPDVLGASSGAAFGAALAILLGWSSAGISSLAFTFGMLSIALVLGVVSRLRSNRLLGLILTGIMVSSLFSSALSLLKLVADPQNDLPAITYWLMGSLAGARLTDARFAAPLIIVAVFVIWLLRWQLNLLTLPDDEARSLGVNPSAARLVLIVAATLITAVCVAVSGMISWVGLVIPHFARLLLGSDHRLVVPGSLIIGAAFLPLVDNFARLLATSEIPLGILTAFIGAPFYIYLIWRGSRR